MTDSLPMDADDDDGLYTDREAVRFDALRNALYHTSRRMHFEKLNRFTNFLVVAFSTATLSSLTHNYEWLTATVGIALGVSGALQIVYDFSGQAKLHHILQRDYYRLLAEVERTTNPTREQIAKWTGEISAISGEEPPTMRALDAVAYNATADALYHDHGHRLRIGIVPSLLKQFVAFHDKEFRYRETSRPPKDTALPSP